MIPKIIPPLTGLTVLATRPAAPCAALCAAIERLGGAAVALPAIEIEPLEATLAGPVDLAIFISVNAVAHGAHLVRAHPGAKIAAIGKATAAALATAELPADLVPETGVDSEALLAHPGLAQLAPRRVLIVRGSGGRELLREAFLGRGAEVEICEVYRRVQPQPDPERIAYIESEWAEGRIDCVTLTSAETLHNLMAMLSERGRERLRATAVVVASRRIAEAAGAAGLTGPFILANGADDAAMLGALAIWQSRARAA